MNCSAGFHSSTPASRRCSTSRRSMNNVPGAVVTMMERTNVETVIVAGKIRKWKGLLQDVDLDSLSPGRSRRHATSSTARRRYAEPIPHLVEKTPTARWRTRNLFPNASWDLFKAANRHERILPSPLTGNQRRWQKPPEG